MERRPVASDGAEPAPEWLAAYLAVSALLGEPLEIARLCIDEASRVAAEPIVRGLRSSSRQARAGALAQPLAEVVLALDAMRLA